LNVSDDGFHFLSSISLNIFQCPFFINGFSTNSFCGSVLWMPRSKRDPGQSSSFQLNFKLNEPPRSSIIFYIFHLDEICIDQFFNFMMKLKGYFWRCTKMPGSKHDPGQCWSYQLNFQLNTLQRSSIIFYIFHLSEIRKSQFLNALQRLTIVFSKFNWNEVCRDRFFIFFFFSFMQILVL